MAEYRKYNKRDIVREVIFFLLFTMLAFVWLFGVQMILSFVAMSVIHFSIEGIFLVTVVGTVIADIVYVIRKIRN